MKKRYKIAGRTDVPMIKTIREKYEEWYIFDDVEAICEKFGVSENLIRKLIYSKYKSADSLLNFDTIIKLSNMFDIPYEDFIAYNALIEHDRSISPEKVEEENNLLKQYSVGKDWEDTIIKYYADKGYFVYKIPTMNSGTVFDIIAIHKGAALMIECKHTESDKLYYAGSGIAKKRDEIDHFVNTTGNNLYIYVKSDKTGTWWTTWVKAKPIFEEKGYITLEDCFKCEVE